MPAKDAVAVDGLLPQAVGERGLAGLAAIEGDLLKTGLAVFGQRALDAEHAFAILVVTPGGNALVDALPVAAGAGDGDAGQQ